VDLLLVSREDGENARQAGNRRTEESGEDEHLVTYLLKKTSAEGADSLLAASE
jgi:hypothetical protein